MSIRQYFILTGFILITTLKPLLAINTNWNTGAGGMIGLSATFGTKVNRIGFLAGGFIIIENVQFNTSFNRLFCFNSYGPNLRRIENQFNIGITGSFGPAMSTVINSEPVFYSPVSNFTGNKHSISYVYKIYTDNISTSQSTGIIGFQSGGIHFYTENDLLIFKGSDKYRTGAISLFYQRQNFQVGITSLLWTGNNEEDKKIKIPPGQNNYDSKYGYYDLSETKHGRFSHGILAVFGAYSLGNAQTISATAGIDSEQVRHTIQNKFIHDMPFIPKKWNNTINPHFPMLDSIGKPFINKDQKIKKPEFFGTISLNPTLFY